MTSLLISPATRRLTHTTTLPFSSNTTFSALADLSTYQNASSLVHTSTTTAHDFQSKLPQHATFNIGYPPLGLTENWQCSVKCDRKTGTIEIRRQGINTILQKNVMKWKVSQAEAGKTLVRLDLELKFKSAVVDGMFSMMESWVAETVLERFAELVKVREEMEKKEKRQRTGSGAVLAAPNSPPPAKKRVPRKVGIASAAGKQKATV